MSQSPADRKPVPERYHGGTDSALCRQESSPSARVTVSPLFGVLMYGLPVLWQDYPKEVRRAWLTLIHGKTGPYPGVVW